MKTRLTEHVTIKVRVPTPAFQELARMAKRESRTPEAMAHVLVVEALAAAEHLRSAIRQSRRARH